MLREETITSSWYSDEKILKIEKENIFSKSWHLLGSIDRIPNKGDYLIKTINEQPIVVIKDKVGNINVFYNVCQHRGCVLLEKDGNSKQIKCGYHGWVYELTGELKAARGFDKEDLDLEQLNLKSIEHYIWMNQIFVKLQSDCNNLPKTLKEIENIISPIKFDNYLFHFRKSYKIKCNWKVYMDNYLEGFHIPLVHPKLNRVIDYKSYSTEIFDNFSLQWCHINAESSPYKKTDDTSKAYYFTLFPNILFNITPGRLQTNIIEPINASSCNVYFDYYFENEEDLESIQEDISFSEEVQNEDINICERIQIGLESDGFDNGVFSKKYETGVSHFQSYIEKKINNG
jgi:choline monooxygenase